MDKNIPFNFVFDYLESLDVTVKPMFGMFGVYVGEKMVMVLRKRKNETIKNGVWIACNDNDATLSQEFPSLRSIPGLTNKTSKAEWQYIPEGADDFETSVIRICELITRGDIRIGRAPQNRVAKKPKN